MKTNIGICNPVNPTRKSLVVDLDAHQSSRTDLFVYFIGSRDRIEQQWESMICSRTPFCSQRFQCLCHPSFLFEQLGLSRRIERNLRRIEWHYIQRHSRSKKRLRCSDIVLDI